MGNVWTIKVVLEFWFCHQKCHFLGLKDGHFWQKCLFSDHKIWHFWWENQNSKTTFIVQTFPKYCRKGFYFMKLSLLSPILAKFQFCWFSGLFWAFFPCKKYKKWNRIFAAKEVLKSKHCQRHNGPEGWVHITSCTQILIKFHTSESRTGINFKISNISTKFKLENIGQT